MALIIPARTKKPTSGLIIPNRNAVKTAPTLSFAQKTMADSNSPFKLSGETTLSAKKEAKPLGFLGDMIKGAFDGVKGMFEATTKLNTKTVESILRADPNYIASKNKIATALNPKAELLKPSTKTERATNLLVSGVSTATTLMPAFLTFTAELEAAKNLPGPLKIPAVAFSKGLEKLGELGSYTVNKGIDVLPVKTETKTAMRPIANEIAPLVSMIVGMKLVHGATGKTVSKVTGKLPLKAETKTNLTKGINFGTKLTLQPFSTAYGLVSARVASKVAEKQQQGVEITPEVGRQIVAEVKQEVSTQGLPDIKPDGSIKPQEAIAEAIAPETTKVSTLSKIKPEFDTFYGKGIESGNYEKFRQTVKNISSEKIETMDYQGIQDLLKERGKEGQKLDNLLYSQELTGNEVLDLFRDKLLQDRGVISKKENFAEMSDQQIADKQLEYYLKQEELANEAIKNRSTEDINSILSEINDSIKSYETNINQYDKISTESQGIRETKGVEKEIGRGEEGTGKVTKSASEINIKLAEQGLKSLSEKELAKYTPITKEQTVKTVSEIMSDGEKAKRIVIGKEEAKLTNAEKQVLFNAVEKKAIKEGDYQTLIELAQSPISTERSLAAQTLGSSAWEKDSVLKSYSDAVKIKEQNYEGKKPLDKAKKDMVDGLKKEIKKAEPKVKDWTSFIESIKC